MNTPYTILKAGYTWYLYGGKHWYAAQTPVGPYTYTSTAPDAIANAQAAIDKTDSGLLRTVIQAVGASRMIV